jgi:hypothetical protein
VRKATPRSTPENELVRKLAARFRIGDTMGYTDADGWTRVKRDELSDAEAAKLWLHGTQLIDDPDEDVLREEAWARDLFQK